MSMPSSETPENRRILVVDDNTAIHEDFRKILGVRAQQPDNDLDDLEASLFGDATPVKRKPTARAFEIDSAYQGQEGLARVEASIAAGRPYALVFMDVRMPPGWDGIETTERIWKIDPSLQVVICTAYSDYSWDQMIGCLGHSENLVILKKPFDPTEVLQLAHALTEKWRLARAAHLKMEQLESMVATRTAELRGEIEIRQRAETELIRARDAAEQANRAKSAFLANMSHEIRTPMNGVLGMCQLLLDSGLTGEQRDLAETLTASGETLLALLNDVLDISKIEAHKMTIENAAFSVEEVVEGVAQLLARKADEKKLELVAAVDPAIQGLFIGDSVRLRQVLLNLVSNAVKFTQCGETAIHVRHIRSDANSARLEFSVSDTGIGIDPEILPHLFHPFTQADASITRRFGGTGLGLAICKRLVEMMGGEIAIETKPGSGSRFHFTLDFPRAIENAALDTFVSDEDDFEGVHALVVDDNTTNRKFLAHLLTSWAADFEEAEDGFVALEKISVAAANAQPYDIVLLDFQMPGMDGLSLARKIRDAYGAASPRMVLLTSHSEQHERTSLDAAGVSSYLFKPLRKQALKTHLLEALPSRSRTPGSHSTHTIVAEDKSLGRAVRILVAEDNPVNQKVAVLQLKRLGYEAVIAGDGREALDAVRNGDFDIVFMDCQMPELDGFGATRAIRQHESTNNGRRTPIIAMTAGAVMGDRDNCIAAGMDDYLSKPVRWESVPDIIRRHLAKLSPTHK